MFGHGMAQQFIPQIILSCLAINLLGLLREKKHSLTIWQKHCVTLLRQLLSLALQTTHCEKFYFLTNLGVDNYQGKKLRGRLPLDILIKLIFSMLKTN